MRTKQYILSIASCLVIVGGCSKSDKQPQTTKAGQRSEAQTVSTSAPSHVVQPAQSNKKASPAPHAGQSLPDPLRGRVKETMDAGGYTYVLLETNQGSTWAAARTFAVTVGDEVEVAGMMPMRNFNSPTLKRTFEEIQFVSGARVVGGTEAPHAGDAAQAVPAQSMPPGHPPIGNQAAPAKSVTSAAPKAVDVEPLPGGFTVARLLAEASELKGKPVRFRGRVVKASRGILGKNWLHIQDGTGSTGTNDITVTSVAGYAPVGSLITVEGTLNTDRDFGAGYTYDVIVEDSKITLEAAGEAAP